MLARIADCSEKIKPVQQLLDEAKKLIKDPSKFGSDIKKAKEVKEKFKVRYLILLVQNFQVF